ncbi:hypothetical protein WJX72_011181 [[Myrmecia] bisecta]|uniref:SAP domain-containing protein n=1 Tax=[Myrmecia] bisecta TaxID=41462 RepID=A0AAW1PEE8_9CHLO
MLSLHPIPASRTCRIRAGQVAWAKSSCSHLRSRRSFCPSCLLLPFQPLHSTNRRLSWPLGIVQRARQHAAPAPRTTAAAAAAKQSGEGAADNEPAGKPRAARQRQRERGVKGAPSPLPTITALRKQPKAKLVEQAQALGLPVDGVKEDLVTRLFDHYTAQAAMGPPAPIGDYVPEDSPSNLADAELAHQREGAAVEGVTVQSLLKLGKGTLKGQLDERGLATQGSKQQLAERLLHALRVAEYEALDEEEGEELRKAEMRLPAGFHREGFSSSETEALGAGDEDEQELANRQALQQARAHRDFLADRDELDIVPASYLSYDPDVTTDEEDWPPEEPDVRYGAHIPPEQQPGIIRDSEGRIVAADFGSGDQALDLLEMMSVKGADLAAEDLMREDEEFEDLLSIRDVLALDLSAEERAFLTGRIADLDADLDEPLDLEEVADELEQAFGGPYRGAEERSDQAAHAMDDSSDDLAMASAEAGAAAGEGVQEEGTGSGVEGEEGEDDDELPLMGQRWRAGDLSLADFERFLVEAEGLAEEDVGPTIEALLADAAAEQDQQGDLAEPGDADLAAADLLFAEDEVTAQETAAEDPEDRRFRRYERLPKRSYEAIAGRQDETVDEEDMEDSAANEAPVDSDLSSSRPSEEAAQSDPSATKRAQDPASSAADTGSSAGPAAGNGAGAAQKLPAPAQPPGVAGRSGAQRRAAAHELLAEVSLDLKEVVRLREQVALRRQVLQSMQKQVSRADESAAETRAQMEALRRQMAGLMTERRAWQQTKLKSLKDATAQVQQNMAAKAQLQAQLTGMEQQLSTLKAELAKRQASSQADPPAVEAQAADLVQPGVVVAAGMLTAAEIGKEAFGLVGRWVGRLMRSREDGADT